MYQEERHARGDDGSGNHDGGAFGADAVVELTQKNFGEYHHAQTGGEQGRRQFGAVAVEGVL